jgi:hypothetical protein
MTVHSTVAGSRGPSVRAVRQSCVRAPTRGATGGRPADKASSHLRKWIVHSTILATTAFAVLDLYLLASGGRH